jgi:general secretion pathway protein G
MKLSENSKNGFTLIELLVVVAIIGLVSSIIYSNLNVARGKGRDAKREENIHQIKIAMEQYYNDNGKYPSLGVDNAGYSVSGLTTPLAPYISSVADDPLGSTYAWYYTRGPVANNSYGINVYFEKTASYCVSGVNIDSGWWSPESKCPF